MLYKHYLTRYVCLFGFLRPTREIFQSFGDVTVTDEELHKDLYSALMTIEQWGFFSNHTCLTHEFGSGGVTTCFKVLGLSCRGSNPDLPHTRRALYHSATALPAQKVTLKINALGKYFEWDGAVFDRDLESMTMSNFTFLCRQYSLLYTECYSNLSSSLRLGSTQSMYTYARSFYTRYLLQYHTLLRNNDRCYVLSHVRAWLNDSSGGRNCFLSNVSLQINQQFYTEVYFIPIIKFKSAKLLLQVFDDDNKGKYSQHKPFYFEHRQQVYFSTS